MCRVRTACMHACLCAFITLQWWPHAASVPAEAYMPLVTHLFCFVAELPKCHQHFLCFVAELPKCHRHSVCLLQNFPNAINTPSFPDSVLRPGHTYQNLCIWRFKTQPRQNRTQRLFMGLGVVLILVAAIAFYTQYYNVNSRYRLRAPRYGKK